MKKDAYTLIGIGALVLSGFLGALHFYNRSQGSEVAAENPTAAQFLIRPDSATLGPASAKVTVVEFLDPECESCAAMSPIVKRILAEDASVRLVVRYMPFHPNSVFAATAIEAAGRQGKYWEALAQLFVKQSEWGAHEAPNPQLIPGFLGEIGLNLEKLQKDMDDFAIAEKIERDRKDGESLGVRQTPTFFVNGTRLMELGYAPLKDLIERERAK